MMYLRRKIRSNDGFTLIELLVVLVVIGIIAALAVPKLAGVVGDAKIETCKANVETIERAIDMYKAKFDSDPANSSALTSAGYLKDWPKCPKTGNSYVLSDVTAGSHTH